MDSFAEVFLSTQTLLLCLGVYMVTFVIRRVIESVWPWIMSNHYWKELFVPIAPIVNGAVLGFVKSFAWPDVVSQSLVARILYGATCGLFSGWAYNRVRSFLKSKEQNNAAVRAATNLMKSTSDALDSMPPPMLDSIPPPDVSDSVVPPDIAAVVVVTKDKP